MKIIRWLDNRFEETLLMIFLLLITVVMAYSVFARYVFNDALSWAEEISRYLFVWSAFLSASMCLKKRSSIKIDMLLTTFSPFIQRIILIAGDLVMLVFFAYVFYGSYNTVTTLIRTGQTSPALLLPMYIVYFSMVLGFGLALIRIVQRLYSLTLGGVVCYDSHRMAGQDSLHLEDGKKDQGV